MSGDRTLGTSLPPRSGTSKVLNHRLIVPLVVSLVAAFPILWVICEFFELDATVWRYALLAVALLGAVLWSETRERETEKRFAQLSGLLGVAEVSLRTELLSYQMDVTVVPKWEEILGRRAANAGLPTDEILAWVHPRTEDGSENRGLWGRSFSFVHFEDQLTGLTQTWSDHDRTFVDEIAVKASVVEGSVFVYNSAFTRLKLSSFLAVSPEALGLQRAFEDEWDDGQPMARLPFRPIVSFLLSREDDAMALIAKFPADLDQQLRECGVTYVRGDEDSDDDDADLWSVDYHEFENDCFRVILRIEPYRPRKEVFALRRRGGGTESRALFLAVSSGSIGAVAAARAGCCRGSSPVSHLTKHRLHQQNSRPLRRVAPAVQGHTRVGQPYDFESAKDDPRALSTMKMPSARRCDSL